MPWVGWVGRLGHGKSVRMVAWARETAAELSRLGPTRLVSNIRIVPPDGVQFEQLPMDGFARSLRFEVYRAYRGGINVVLAIDEIDTVFDAKEWQRVKKIDRMLIKQARKFHIEAGWTAQFVDQVEKALRNITEQVTLVRAFPSPSLKSRLRGRRPWFIYEQHFRPGAVRELMATRVDPDRRMGRGLVRYKREWEAWYDTDELIWPEGMQAEFDSIMSGQEKTPVTDGDGGDEWS